MINCAFENGDKTSLRHVVVGVIAVNKNNEVLIIKRAPDMHAGNKYAIPGGFLDRDENTEQAALRELEEETGYKGKILYMFYFNDNPFRPKEDRQNVEIVYAVEVTSGEKRINKEVSEIKWVAQNNLPKEEEFAFDHRGLIQLFYQHLQIPFTLPVFSGRSNK